MRLAVVASHPIQYQAPLFRELSRRLDLRVFFAHAASAIDQSKAGYGVAFQWDVDLLSGYENRFLDNVSSEPDLERFGGCDTPAIFAELGSAPFDGLLILGWHLKSFWQATWAAKRLGLPVMVRGDSHLETPRSLLKRVGKHLAYPLILRTFDAGLYVGKRSQDYWRHYRYPAARLFSSPHCVDNQWFATRATADARRSFRVRHGISAEEKVVLFAGRLVDFKRPLDLIHAAGLLRFQQRSVTVVVAGSGPLVQAVCSAAEGLGIPLVSLGFRNQTEMPAVYAASDLLVLPSDGNETWGLVANEALACGLPVIISDACGSAPDLAADSLAGRIFSLGDVRALASAIASVLEDPPRARDIAARAAAYSLSSAADGVCRALETIRNHDRATLAPS